MNRGDNHNPASLSEQNRRLRQASYYAPSGPPPGGAETWRPLPPDIVRVKLTADWAAGYDGAAVLVELDDAGAATVTDRAIALRDPLSLVSHPVPSGTYLWARDTFDGPSPATAGSYYEPIVGSTTLSPGGADLNMGAHAIVFSGLANGSAPNSSIYLSSTPTTPTPAYRDGGGNTRYLDALPKGAVILWAGTTSAVPAGWAIMNGTANAAGSGIDMTGFFARGKSSGTPDNTAHGSDTHGHSGGTGTPLSYTNITVTFGGAFGATDANHTHSINSDSNVPAHKELYYIEKLI